METHVAIVLGPEGVRAVTAADSEQRLTEKLAEYVRENAELLLWPADARVVFAHLDAGRSREASEHYFLSVGGRWEREVLKIAVVKADASWAVPGSGYGFQLPSAEPSGLASTTVYPSGSRSQHSQ